MLFQQSDNRRHPRPPRERRKQRSITPTRTPPLPLTSENAVIKLGKTTASKGNVGGRPSVVDDDKLAVARARHAKGDSVTAIAKALGIGRATLYRHLGESA
ncbi:helix-turn-helix domain-containing protein [Streptomyces sp. PCS3-D2]|uniref:helix-turn-helix domain-containing protein n=1 Tax=Streptomyces sp. PCS3-D2 TaxID=1460244 RepID=UPI00272A7D18|nr:helix-turn-helix domain-containing protein [Streptomyces sp. PCS3-D2]